MTKSVDIPDELHDLLVARAKQEGLSVTEYLMRELVLNSHGKAEVVERIRNRTPVDLGISVAELVREGREARDCELTDKWASSTPRH